MDNCKTIVAICLYWIILALLQWMGSSLPISLGFAFLSALLFGIIMDIGELQGRIDKVYKMQELCLYDQNVILRSIAILRTIIKIEKKIEKRRKRGRNSK